MTSVGVSMASRLYYQSREIALRQRSD